MANQLYGHQKQSSSIYNSSSRSAIDAYHPEQQQQPSSLRTSSRYLFDPHSLSSDPPSSFYRTTPSDSHSLRYSSSDRHSLSSIDNLGLTSAASRMYVPAAAATSLWPSFDASSTLSKRPSEALYDHPVLGAHMIGQNEAWFASDSLAKRPRLESASNLPIYPQRPGEKDCSHYMLTRICKFGDNCKFDHPIWVPAGGIPDWKESASVPSSDSHPERPGEPDCPYFLKTQKCKFGQMCKFNHPKDKLDSSSCKTDDPDLPDRPSEPVCSFYMKTGKCKFGTSCKFHHPKDIKVQSDKQEAGDGVQTHSIDQHGSDGTAGDGNIIKPTSNAALSYNSKGLPMRPDEVNCPFYMKTGSCKYGITCRYNHPDRNVINPTAAMVGHTVFPSLANFNVGLVNPAASIFQSLQPRLAQTMVPMMYPQRPGQIECDFYMKTGECKFGEKCRFHHPVDRSAPTRNQTLEQNVKFTLAGLPRREGVEHCPFYMKTNKRCLDTDALPKLILDVKELLKVNDTEVNLDESPVLSLQSLVLLLIQKFKELEKQASLSINEANFRAVEVDELQSHVESLNSLIIQQQNDVLVLRASLVQAKDGFDVMQADLLQKVKELEQSEQRVASVREKLSIAVAKGKGLVVQRDSLKQSLAEMSSELDKYSQELQLKDSRLLEVEEKLKDYSEAGERMEALESELTYIRNSATALRESFLLKDSTLQRIEEILEDLELPDHFHSKDILEKVEWLAKTVAGNSLPPADWDQRSSVGGGSYSDTGFVVADGGKDDGQPTSNLDDDSRRKYEELQAKYYELAEQNDMLEQSLMERNILVQRWEEVLDRINTPTQIRSMEPEERIHWLGTAVSEADHHMRSLQQKIENLENYCESLSSDLEESQRRTYELETILHEKESALSVADVHTKSLQQKIDEFESCRISLSTDLEESQRRISELEFSLQAVIQDKETLSSRLATSTSDREIALHTIEQYELELDSLRKEVSVLQGNLAKNLENVDQMNQIESTLKRLQGLILDALQDSGIEEESSDVSSIQVLERLIVKLLNHDREVDVEGHDHKVGVQEHTSAHTAKALMVTDMENEHLYEKDVIDLDDSMSRSRVHEGQKVADLNRELAEALDEIVRLREEINLYMQKNQSVVSELEEVDKRQKELLELVNQEEQKSASLREKLNLAVRKGKSLVQQRDGLKQNIEEMTAEIIRLKSTINSHESSLAESSQKISDFCLQIETYKAFEAENLSLKDRLLEVEQHLQQNSNTLSLLLSKLGEISAFGGTIVDDPLQKLEEIVKSYSDLQNSTASFELEAKKSKRSAELLLAELNEVQERNDGLQEELERAHVEIINLSKERDLANSAKIEALSHVDKLSDEREKQLAELERLKSSVNGVKKVFFDISTLSDDVFAKDLELLHNVRAQMESNMDVGTNPVSAKDHAGLVSVNSRFKDFWSRTSWGNKIPDSMDESAGFKVCEVIEQHLQQLTETIGDFKERLQSHSMLLRTEAEWLSAVVGTMLREIASQRNSLESIKGDNIRLESVGKEKDMEGVVFRRILSLLYEACISSIMEIENRKAQLIGENFSAEDLRINLPALPTADGVNFSGVAVSSSEESVKFLADKLLGSVKDFVDFGIKGIEGQSKEMKTTIFDLQKELQEKDVQRERICMELVSQIKEAEATAAHCSRDLQSMTNYAHDLENKLDALGKDRSLLERRVAELQEDCLSSTELGEKVKSLTGVVAAKEQEIEVLMQALEEEENQMEALRSEIEKLEKAVEQKNIDLDNVEASRAKALKKLSVTVSKFDELHHMSEGLLSEIENLQTQLQDRDAEISFLRQEVTRCTNDVLEVTKMSKERSSSELQDFLTWLNTSFSGVLKRNVHAVDGNVSPHPEYKEHVQRDITSIISELEDLRLAAQSKDTLLQAERNKMEELLHTKAALEASLHEKELHLKSLQGVGVSGLGTSEIVEVEPAVNKWISPAPSQVRSLRKVNNDQVSIAIDTDAENSGRIEDEDDDKVHGFKSLTTSRFIPRFTRPVSDMIDGLWVSCDRALMRQPAFRLGIMIYWAVLHALLASLIV